MELLLVLLRPLQLLQQVMEPLVMQEPDSEIKIILSRALQLTIGKMRVGDCLSNKMIQLV